MRFSLIAGLTCTALVVGLTPATAQTLMGVPSPAVPGSVPADAAAAPDATAPKPKPKQKGPPGAVTRQRQRQDRDRGRHHGGRQDGHALKPLAPKGGLP